MDNFDKKTGYFLPGNTVSKTGNITKEIRELKRKNKNAFLKMFFQYGMMSIKDIVEITKHETALTPMQRGVIKGWEDFSKGSDHNMFKYFLSLMGVSVDAKVNDKDDTNDNGEELIKLTKEERKEMLKIALELVEKEGE